jgi:hypothetical protein
MKTALIVIAIALIGFTAIVVLAGECGHFHHHPGIVRVVWIPRWCPHR